MGITFNSKDVPLLTIKKISKKYSRLSWGLILSISLLLALTACNGDGAKDKDDNSSASDTPATLQVRVSVAQAPVFTIPSSDTEIIINLFEGDLRKVLGKSEPDRVGLTYYQIDLGNRLGWIAETQVEVQGDESTLAVMIGTPTILPAATLVGSAPTGVNATGDPLISVNQTRAIVFSAPNRSADELATIFEDEEFAALAVTEPDNLGDIYYLIQIGAEQGWVLATQVVFSGDDSQLLVANVVTETPPVADEVELTAIVQEASLTLDAVNTVAATLVPSNTPTRTATAPPATLDPSLSPQPSPTYSDDLEIQPGPEPPLNITVPEGWDEGHYLVPVANQFAAGNIAMSIYEGELADGKRGTIWILWGFPNIADPLGGINLWADGLQLLRGLLFIDCNMGIDTKREFMIDNQTAEGTYYSAVDCGEGNDIADIAGWFGALQYEGGNFAVFTGIEPVERVTEGLPEIQAIVDTIQFQQIAN